MKLQNGAMFEEPTLVFVTFASEDIITTSGDGVPGIETPDIPVP